MKAMIIVDKNSLCKIVTKSQVVPKFSVTKSRLHCTNIFRLNSLAFPKNWIFLCLVITQGCTICGVEKSRALEQ